MEYQDYELRTHERLEKGFKDAQAQSASRRQALAETGIWAFEGIQGLEFASYYSLAIECSGEEGKAKKKEKLAERKLRLAERRLKTGESKDLGKSVERATWVALFLKEVESSNEGILALYVWISIETANAYLPKLPSDAYFREPILAPPILVLPPFPDAPILDAPLPSPF